MMKKHVFIFLALILCMICAAAGAAPAVTDGTTTGWIAENNYLFLQKTDGRNLQMPMEMADLLTMTEDELICLARDQRVIAVKKDGSGSRVVDSVTAETYRNLQTKSVTGIQLPDETAQPATAAVTATDGVYFYEVEKADQAYVLRVSAVQDAGKLVVPGSRDAYAAALSNKTVPEALGMTVTREALTLTGVDHQVTVMNLINGEINRYPATSTMTAAATLMNGTLYRYQLTEDQRWVLESTTVLASPTPAPTAVPTSTPVPTATPKPTKTPYPYGQTDDDGTIYFGASGKTVKKIQTRLNELGYPAGKVDGKYGDETQLAINLFCDAIHVREHRYITRKVQKKLMAKDAPSYDPYLPLKKGDQGISVLYMQQRLKELGYNPGKLDGVYGKQTVAAVALFQKDNAIKLGKKEKAGEVASREMLIKLYAPDPDPTTAPPKPTNTPKPTKEPKPTVTNKPTDTPAPTETTDPASKTDL